MNPISPKLHCLIDSGKAQRFEPHVSSCSSSIRANMLQICTRSNLKFAIEFLDHEKFSTRQYLKRLISYLCTKRDTGSRL